MTLTLYLEDNYGKSTSIAVQPEDTFQVFLQNAKSILGYDVDISSITGTEQVLLNDNVYQFLIKAKLNLQEQEIKESSSELIAAGEIELPTQEESGLLDDDMQEDIIYILDDNTKENTSRLGFVDSFAPGTSSEFFLRNNIGDDSVSYIVYESEQQDECMYILGDEVINTTPEDATIVELENTFEPLLNEMSILKPINKNSIIDFNVRINESKNAALSDPSAVKTLNNKQLAGIIKDSCADNIEFEIVQTNKTDATPTTLTIHKQNINNNISINSQTLLQHNSNVATPKIVANVQENSQSFCTFCKRKITNEFSKSYIFDSDDTQLNKIFNKIEITIPKLICLYCLKSDYEVYDRLPKKLNTNDFLVMQNKLQKVYKKKAGGSHEKNIAKDKRLYTTGGAVNEKDSIDSFNGVTKNPPIIIISDIRIPKKECLNVGYVCRICGLDLKELRLAIPHSVTHMTEIKKPAVFSCILCTKSGYSQFQELRHHMQSEHSLMKQRMVQQNAKKTPKLNAIAHRKTKSERISDISVKNKGRNISKFVEVIEVPPKDDGSLEMAEVEWLDEDTGLMVNILRVVEKEEFDIEEGEYISPNESYESSLSNKLLDHAYFENQNDDGNASDSDSDSGVWIVQSGDVWLEGQDVEVPLDSDQNPSVEDPEVVQEELQSVMIAPRMHQCRDCKKRYTTAERMARHVCHFKLDSDNGHFESSNKMAGENGSHHCPFCDSTFHTKIRLQFHTRHFHLSSANTDEGESSTLAAGTQSLRCSLCPKKMFESEATLYDHIHFAHPRTRRHLCPEEGCGKAFHLKATLNNHIRSHAGERTHRCEVCGKQFFDRQTLGEHSVTHLKVKPFQCHICLKFLNRKSRLRMHLLTHESEPIGAMVITCGNCDMAFKDTEQAEAHLNELGQCCESTEIQNPDSPSSLPKTTVPSNDDTINTIENVDSMKPRSNLTMDKNKAADLSQEGGDHLETPDSSLLDGLSDIAKKRMTAVKIDKVYRCEYCEKVYSAQDALNVHRSCHEGLKNPFICHICSATFSTYSRCTTHKTTHGYYRNKSSRRSEGSLVTTSNHDQFPVVKHFLCEVCGKSYLHWTYLQVHRRQKHSDNVHMYKCRLCGDEFPNSWGIAYHRKKAHGQTSGSAAQTSTPMPAIEKFNYSCAECGVVVKNKAQLLVHKRSCHAAANVNSKTNAKQGLYSCLECGKRYITQVGLKGHMKSHHEPDSGGRPHRCQECGKTFVHATGLTTHGRRVHMKETNFACSNCGKTFYSACDLQSHLRRHTGERPFQCDVCGHAFRTKGMRNEHLRIHTGERPYPCDICGLAFRRSYAMKNHRLIHTGERRYRCSLCPRAFRVRADLNTHIRHKHGSEPTESDRQAPVMVVNMPNEFTVNHQEEIHINLNSMEAENIESLEGRVDPSGIIIFNEEGESMLQNEQVLKLQKPNNMAIKTINSDYSNNPKTKGSLRNKEILSDINMMFEDSADNVYVNDTQESIFLSDDGRFVIDNDTEIIGQLSVDGNSLIVMSKDGDKKILNVNDLQINSDENVLLRGVTIETVDSFVEDNYNSEDLLPEGDSKFVKVWSDAEDSESGQVDDVNMEGSKSPDDARRFNELFSSSVANN